MNIILDAYRHWKRYLQTSEGDMIVLGEPACTRRFLHLFNSDKLRHAVETIHKAGYKTGIMLPPAIREKDIDQVLERLQAVKNSTDRIYTADAGLPDALGAGPEYYYLGMLANHKAAELFKELGFSGIRLVPPSVSVIRAIENGPLRLEITVCGLVPIMWTSWCMHWLAGTSAGHRCQFECLSRNDTLKRRGELFYVDGCVLRPLRPNNITLHLKSFALDSVVIDTFRMKADKVSEAVRQIRCGRAVKMRNSWKGNLLQRGSDLIACWPWRSR